MKGVAAAHPFGSLFRWAFRPRPGSLFCWGTVVLALGLAHGLEARSFEEVRFGVLGNTLTSEAYTEDCGAPWRSPDKWNTEAGASRSWERGDRDRPYFEPDGPCPAALRHAEGFADVGTPTGGALALIGYAWYRRRLASGYYDDVR